MACAAAIELANIECLAGHNFCYDDFRIPIYPDTLVWRSPYLARSPLESHAFPAIVVLESTQRLCIPNLSVSPWLLAPIPVRVIPNMIVTNATHTMTTTVSMLFTSYQFQLSEVKPCPNT